MLTRGLFSAICFGFCYGTRARFSSVKRAFSCHCERRVWLLARSLTNGVERLFMLQNTKANHQQFVATSAKLLPVPHHVLLQKLAGVTGFVLDDLLRRALGDKFAAARATFGAKVNNPIGAGD